MYLSEGRQKKERRSESSRNFVSILVTKWIYNLILAQNNMTTPNETYDLKIIKSTLSETCFVLFPSYCSVVVIVVQNTLLMVHKCVRLFVPYHP